MKNREFFRKSQFPLMLALGTYPLAEILLAFRVPEWMSYGWMFPAAYAAMAIILLVLPAKLRIAFSICGAAFFLTPFHLFPAGEIRYTLMIIGGVYAAMLIWSLCIPAWDAYKEMSARWIGICLAIELLGCFFSVFSADFAQVAWSIRGSFLGFVLLTMLSMNRGSLNLAAGDNWNFAAPMRWKNRLLTVGMFAIALGFAAVPWIYDLLAAGARWIMQLFDKPPVVSDPTMETTEFIRATEENWQEIVLEGVATKRTSEQVLAIMAVIAVAAAVALVSVASHKLVNLLARLVRNLLMFVGQTSDDQQADFVDEITDTRAETRYERSGKEKKRKQTLWRRGMTPAERLRYYYRRLRIKHPEWKDNKTARENLPEEIAELYERARYSDHPVTSGDAERFRNKTKYGIKYDS